MQSFIEIFAESLENLGSLIKDLIIDPSVKRLENNQNIEIHPSICDNPTILKEIFKTYCHKMHWNAPSEKNIQNLARILKNGNTKKYELSKTIKLEISNKLKISN